MNNGGKDKVRDKCHIEIFLQQIKLIMFTLHFILISFLPQRAVMQQNVVCLSVCLSVTLSYRDHIWLEYFENNFTAE